MIKLIVNNKTYKVKVAQTEDEREVGLQNVTELPEDEGMLFVFDESDEVSFWMQDTKINLDIIFIDEDETVIDVQTGIADTEDAHTAENVMYVLEVNEGSGIMKGDKVEVDDTEEAEDDETDENDLDEPEEEQLMMILNHKGESQMNLEGGERIFSRKNTISLLKFAKRAYAKKTSGSYQTLARKVFAFMDAQDERGNDYIDAPE